MRKKSASGKFVVSMRAVRASSESYEGICLKCGASAEGCEPDAANYKCDGCGAFSVMGLENAFLGGDVVVRGA